MKQAYINGSWGHNNPAKIVLEEAKVMFPGREIECLISISTGYPRMIALATVTSQWNGSIDSVDKALMAIAADCKHTAQELAQEYHDMLNVYFRFNVQRGMEQVLLEQWGHLPKVRVHTEQYLKDVDVSPKVDKAAAALRKDLGQAATMANTLQNEQALVES
ncbi:hypothetical protein F5146DRAFT_1136044 [Armillaria mellea]|nr:hypothetical protein F5146DRAFT_1136044 [Armillaria mellea]